MRFYCWWTILSAGSDGLDADQKCKTDITAEELAAADALTEAKDLGTSFLQHQRDALSPFFSDQEDKGSPSQSLSHRRMLLLQRDLAESNWSVGGAFLDQLNHVFHSEERHEWLAGVSLIAPKDKWWTKDMTAGGVPKLIHTTWKSWAKMGASARSSAESWMKMNPGWRYVFWDDEAVVRSLNAFAPPGDETMLREMLPIERFDYFRYMLLFRIGGVYSDIDVVPVTPIEQWWNGTSAPSLITGWEDRLERSADVAVNSFARQDQIQQWTIASRPGHPVLQDVLQRIRTLYAARRPGNTLNFTGPGPWTDAVVAHLRRLPPRMNHGNGLANRVWGKHKLLLLEKEAFCYQGNGSEWLQLVHHNYWGSWKSTRDMSGVSAGSFINEDALLQLTHQHGSVPGK